VEGTGYFTTVVTIDIKSLQNRLLKVCYVPATSTRLPRLLFLLLPLTVLIKQTRQAIHTIRQSILLRCLWFTYVRKMFIKSTTGVNILKLFFIHH
jgi:hypothetical protein